MENMQSNIGFFPFTPVCDRRLSTEVANDFTLPDYKSEIKRLLCSKAHVIPSSEYIGNGNTEICGEILYTILYLGADGELYSAELRDKYSVSSAFEFTPHNANTDSISLFPTCAVESINARVLGPRKLSMRSRIGCRVLALSPAIYNPNYIGDPDTSSIETLTLEAPAIEAVCCSSEPLSFSEMIPIEGAGDSVRIINTSADIVIGECIATEDKISLRGDVVVKILYCDDATTKAPQLATRKIPFSNSIYCDGATNGGECLACGYVSSITSRVEENGALIEIEAIIKAIQQRNTYVPYIKDAYSTKYLSVGETDIQSIMKAHKCAFGSLTQSDVISLEEANLHEDTKIIDSWSRAKIEQLAHEKGKTVLYGKCEHQVLYLNEGEYFTRSFELPFKYELECRCEQDSCGEIVWCADAFVHSTRTRNDKDRLHIDCELCFWIFAQELCEHEMLERLTLGEKLDRAQGEILICFPEKDASVWEIAKRYGKESSKIRAQNSLDPNEVSIKKRFLVI